MASVRPTADPYRVLELPRGADLAQVKAAHRRLAKLYHPDASTGDEARFLAVQEAYLLLSDPLRRREWDRRHAPGPVRATASSTTKRPNGRRRAADGVENEDRPTGGRTSAWTAERVPWWEEFTPRGPGGGPRAPGGARARKAAGADPAEPGGTPSALAGESDVFSRSSGAAWSAAARRHFRRGDGDLPSRGVWRYRGTQVVTGAEARKVAAEEDEERKRR